MELIGFLVSNTPTPLTREEWIACIESETDLASYERREVRNPATGEMVFAQPPATSKKLMRNNEQIGSFSYSPSEPPYIDVESKPEWKDETIEFAKKLGRKINASFSTDDPLA